MSGGSYDYAYQRIEDLANEIQRKNPLRKAFRVHLLKVAKALHDIEWVDSGDCLDGNEDAAIRACLGEGAAVAVLGVLIEEGKNVLYDLSLAIAAAEKEVG